MHKSIVLVLATACGAAAAQTPANNPMPDGSRDMYVGLGVLSAPEWEGARERRVTALPLIQVQWSNGAFISGMSAGMHLSDNPSVEYGPLLNIQPRRSESGSRDWADGFEGALLGPSRNQPPANASPLQGMNVVATRLEAGGFVNYYLSERLRLHNVLVYGAGNDHDGLRYTVDLQTIATDLSPRHKLSALVGLTAVNRDHNMAYFGVSEDESRNSRNRMYAPGGGIRDVHASVRWNYALSPSWMVSTQVQVKRLQGDAARSPLVERTTNTTVSTGLAYRF